MEGKSDPCLPKFPRSVRSPRAENLKQVPMLQLRGVTSVLLGGFLTPGSCQLEEAGGSCISRGKNESHFYSDECSDHINGAFGL